MAMHGVWCTLVVMQISMVNGLSRVSMGYNIWCLITLWSVFFSGYDTYCNSTTVSLYIVFHLCIMVLALLPKHGCYTLYGLFCFTNTLLLPLSPSLLPLICLYPSVSCPSSYLIILFSYPAFPYLCLLSCTLPVSPQVDSMDNFTPSNTPSREDDPKSHLKSRSRSPSMASDMEPIEVRHQETMFLYRRWCSTRPPDFLIATGLSNDCMV